MFRSKIRKCRHASRRNFTMSLEQFRTNAGSTWKRKKNPKENLRTSVSYFPCSDVLEYFILHSYKYVVQVSMKWWFTHAPTKIYMETASYQVQSLRRKFKCQKHSVQTPVPITGRGECLLGLKRALTGRQLPCSNKLWSPLTHVGYHLHEKRKKNVFFYFLRSTKWDKNVGNLRIFTEEFRGVCSTNHQFSEVAKTRSKFSTSFLPSF